MPTVASVLRARLAILALAGLTSCGGAHASIQAPPGRPGLFAPWQPVADRLLATGLQGHGAWTRLEQLCDGIGHRLSGSPQLDQAIAWAVQSLQKDGHENVHTEPVTVPRWVRGRESLGLVEPRPLALTMLGLGGSVATPAQGITAEVVVASDEAGLKALGERVRGRIVLFDLAMPAWTAEHGARYAESVHFRVHGARLAAAQGAVAVLVRSVTAHSLDTAHTGALFYGDAPVQIPAAAVSVEHAGLLHRLADRGKVVVTLRMEAHLDGTAPSANVIAELRGTAKPEEIVVLGGHLDSWDVGQGAHDDGAGVTMAMEALDLLRRAGLRPKRTLRLVLWTNEENGLMGARQYARDHAAELPRHVAGIEADSGGFAPIGLGIELQDPAAQARAVRQVRDLLQLVAPLGPQVALEGQSGADVSPFVPAGIPALEQFTHGEHYFDYHHTAADTLDKVDPQQLQRSAVALAIEAYVLADWPGRLGDAP